MPSLYTEDHGDREKAENYSICYSYKIPRSKNWNENGITMSPLLQPSNPMNNTSNQINEIELTVRAGDNPVVRKEEEGTPVFVTVFCLHNKIAGDKIITIPITVKASKHLAEALIQHVKKGYRFLVRGRLDYWKTSENNRDKYSIFAENIEEICPPKYETKSEEAVEL
jgi:hypothetical protein